MERLRFLLALWISKLAAAVIPLLAPGRGTNFPGVLALRIDPDFLRHFRGASPERTVFVTGTNGKSTAVALLYRALTQAGYRVISNLDGANMTSGVAVPLLRSSSLTGQLTCDYLVMETDERYVARIGTQLPAGYLCVTNIQKDQVQRNGEPGVILNKLREAVSPDLTLILNHDEPNCFSLSRAQAAAVVTYGVEPGERSSRSASDFFSVGMPCPVCHHAISFDACNITNVGPFHCPGCGLGADSVPDYPAHDVSFAEHRFCCQDHTYSFHYSAPQFLYSYLLALAAARTLGVPEEAIAAAFDAFRSESHRIMDARAGCHRLHYHKMKQENSETLQDTVNFIAGDSQEKLLLLALDEYIDFNPPYLNTCFLFDCDFKRLKTSGLSQWACTGRYAAPSAAIRLAYDGFDPAAGTLLPSSDEKELAAYLDKADCDNSYLVEEIPCWQRKEHGLK